jgi:hypothetical protein
MLNIKELSKELGSKFFDITFVKKDGTTRSINGRLGVKKGLHGGVRTTDPDEYLIVWSMKDQGYRNIKLDKVLRIALSGQVIYSKEYDPYQLFGD